MRRVHWAVALAVTLGGLSVVPAAAHDTTGKTTVQQTIVPIEGAGFKFLRLGPGEPYVVRTDLASGQAQRAVRRKSLIYFGQITDWQLPDEESPAREERSTPIRSPGSRPRVTGPRSRSPSRRSRRRSGR
jgi:hypothetical protein